MSLQAQSIIAEAIEILNNVASVQAYTDGIYALELDAKNQLDCSELEPILVSLAIFRHSAKLWMPIGMGGLGYYDKYLHLTSTANSRAACCENLKNALVGDGVSAGLAMHGYVAAALLGPVGWGFIASSSISIAGSSLFNYFRGKL